MGKQNWWYFRKSDRRVLVLLLVVGLLTCTILAMCQREAEKDQIELPEHWWEKE